MRAPFLFRLSSLTMLLALAACGETFEATDGSGNAGGGGKGGGSGGAGPGGGGQGGAGGTTSTGTTGSGGEAPLCEPKAGDECSTCLAQQCDAYCKCVNDIQCGLLAKCITEDGGDMPSPEWIQYCWTLYPSHIATLGHVQICGSQKCGACDYKPVGECATCEYEKCAYEINSCLGSGDCQDFIECITPCGDDDLCYQDCTTSEAAGWSLYQPLVDCSKGKCGPVCP